MTGIHSFWKFDGKDLNKAFVEQWTLSHHYLHKWFGQTALITDRKGEEVAEKIGLRYSEVLPVLDVLPPVNVWALGKLASYLLACGRYGPFCHVDLDVFLTKPLPEKLQAAPIFAERLELWRKDQDSVRSGSYYLKGIPKELRGRIHEPEQRAYCCGIFGGADTDKIKEYALRSVRLAESPEWSGIDGTMDSVLLEQYALADFEPVEVLLPAWPTQAEVQAAGYYHLQGSSKSLKRNIDAVSRNLRLLGIDTRGGML